MPDYQPGTITETRTQTVICVECQGEFGITGASTTVAREYFAHLGWRSINGEWVCKDCAEKPENVNRLDQAPL